jgi:hypothetical protein
MLAGRSGGSFAFGPRFFVHGGWAPNGGLAGGVAAVALFGAPVP